MSKLEAFRARQAEAAKLAEDLQAYETEKPPMWEAYLRRTGPLTIEAQTHVTTKGEVKE